MCLNVELRCLCTKCAIPGGTEEGIKCLGLELQRVMSSHVGAQNTTWAFCNRSWCSYTVNHCLSPRNHLSTGWSWKENTSSLPAT